MPMKMSDFNAMTFIV